MGVEDMMTRNVFTIAMDTTIEEIVNLGMEHRMGDCR
jgi:predicted transcriptional regulator